MCREHQHLYSQAQFPLSRSTELPFHRSLTLPNHCTCGTQVPCDFRTHGCRPIHSHFEPHASFFLFKDSPPLPSTCSLQGLWYYLPRICMFPEGQVTDFTLDDCPESVPRATQEPSGLPATWREGEKMIHTSWNQSICFAVVSVSGLSTVLACRAK